MYIDLGRQIKGIAPGHTGGGNDECAHYVMYVVLPFARLQGTGVMITIFGDFRSFSAKKFCLQKTMS
jgi:hypothetical protein